MFMDVTVWQKIILYMAVKLFLKCITDIIEVKY